MKRTAQNADPALLTTQEAALELGISQRQVERYLKSGELKGIPYSNGHRIQEREIQRFRKVYLANQYPEKPSLEQVQTALQGAARAPRDATLKGETCETYILQTQSRIKTLDALASHKPTHTADGYTAHAGRTYMGGFYYYVVAYNPADRATDSSGGV